MHYHIMYIKYAAIDILESIFEVMFNKAIKNNWGF